MRSDLAARATVTSLARTVGLSRQAFARRFVAATSASPLRYLTRLRLERAAELLVDSNAGLAEIATGVGYDSEFAFNRAFRRHHGTPPGRFRRRVAELASRIVDATAKVVPIRPTSDGADRTPPTSAAATSFVWARAA